MNVHLTSFAVAVSLFLLVMLGATLLFVWRARKMTSAETSLQDLLSQLHALDRSKLALVARDAEPGDGQALEGWELWDLVGGLEGLQQMAENCELLIQLAFHVQQWYPEALPVAEQLRLNAREIQWHLERLQGAEGRGHLRIAFPDYAQRATAIYYGMTQHVLALYQASQVPGLAQVEAVFSITQPGA